MRVKPNELWSKLKKKLAPLWQQAKTRSKSIGKSPKWKKFGGALKKRIPGKLKSLELDLKEIEVKNINKYSSGIRTGLLILGVLLLAGITTRIISIWIRPVYPRVQAKSSQGSGAGGSVPTEDYDAILRRNMFNVEGTIPDPFDQGLLDCMSQARPSQQRVQLLGTIVMNDERHSVALIQDEGSNEKIGVKKDETFGGGKFIALKVERKKLCFQVRESQDLEYIEIPEDPGVLGIKSAQLSSGSTTDGITSVSETDFVVKKDFLEKNLLNLNDILQTARAVPYIEPGSGKFKGFLVQSMEPNSPFASLGVRQGDILTSVNSIVLDNAGKGLEAFQTLRNTNKINLQVIRGGSLTSLNFDVK